MQTVIFGNHHLAEVADYYLTRDTFSAVAAFTVESDYIEEDRLFGRPVIPFETVESVYPPSEYLMLVMIGYQQVNQLRKRIYEEAKSKGYNFVTYISPDAHVHGSVGENCFIFEDNVVQPFASIGDNTILWSGNHIGHHARIGSHVFIASHVVVSGLCDVGDRCFLGVNATLRDNVTIAPGCVIGAGALILHDTEPDEVYRGVRSHPMGIESYELRKI